MTVRLIRSPALATRAEYAYAAVTDPASSLIFTAGACPLDENGVTVAPGDYVAQARVVMDNLETALAESGASLRDVAKSTVYVASSAQADLVAVWQIVRERFGEHDAPSTLLGVTVLGYDGQLVEVEAVAVVSAGPDGADIV